MLKLIHFTEGLSSQVARMIRYNLYQLMCESRQQVTFQEVLHRVCSFSIVGPLMLETYVIYGKSGFKEKLEYVKGMFFPFSEVGSVHIKLINKETNNKVSVIVFSNKKVKISGGISNVKKNHSEYVSQMTTCVGKYLDMTLHTPVVSLINAQFKIKMSPVMFRKFIFMLQKSNMFHSVCEPTLSGRGRISCAKVYPFNGRRGHFQVDPRGTVQVFGFKSFDELNTSVDIFSTFCSFT